MGPTQRTTVAEVDLRIGLERYRRAAAGRGGAYAGRMDHGHPCGAKRHDAARRVLRAAIAAHSADLSINFLAVYPGWINFSFGETPVSGLGTGLSEAVLKVIQLLVTLGLPLFVFLGLPLESLSMA